MSDPQRELETILWLVRLVSQVQQHAADQRQRSAQAVGKWLRKTRGLKGLGLREASRQLGVTAAYLCDMELGRRLASEKWIRKAINYKSK